MSPVVNTGVSHTHAGAGTTTISLAQPAKVTVMVTDCPDGMPLITPLFTVPTLAITVAPAIVV